MITFVVASAHLPMVGEAVRAILAQDAAPLIDAVLVFGADVHGVVPVDPRVALVHDLPPGPACRAYNAGVARAQTPFVALVDGDCLLRPDWVRRILARHAAGWDVVAGGVEIPVGSYWSTAYNFAGFHEFLADVPSGPRNYLPSMNLSFRRSAAQAVGPLREDIPRLYDFDWTLRMRAAGYRLFFDAAARAGHHPYGITPAIMWRTWFAGGSCSQAVRRAFPELIAAPRMLDHAALIAILAPTASTWATGRIAWRNRRDDRVWAMLPALWMSRLAWCLGAASGRRYGALHSSAYRTEVLGRQR